MYFYQFTQGLLKIDEGLDRYRHIFIYKYKESDWETEREMVWLGVCGSSSCFAYTNWLVIFKIFTLVIFMLYDVLCLTTSSCFGYRGFVLLMICVEISELFTLLY